MKYPFPSYALASTARLSLLTTALTLSVQAAPLTWKSAGPSNNWSTASGNENWTPGDVVWTQNADAIFDLSSGGGEAVTVLTNNVVNDITFGISGFSIAAGAGSLILGNDLSSTITVTNGADSASIAETLGNNTSTPSSLTKAGPGTLTLNGTAANTYSGTTTINAGTLVASHEGSLGIGPVVNNATLSLNKPNVTFTGIGNVLTGAGIVNVTTAGIGTGTNTVTLNGDYSGFTGTWNIGTGAAAGAGKVQMNGKDNAAAILNVAANATLLVGANTHNATVRLAGGDTGESLGQLRVDLVGTNWAGPVILAGDMTGAGDGIIGSNSGPAQLSGNISETGGSRTLTKSGGGTLIISGNNTYSGPTRSFSGNISVPSINNTGVSGPLGSNALIALGREGAASSLFYTGAGETTNRTIDLAGSTGGAGINHLGTGLLKFTSNFTVTGAGSKGLTLSVAAGASGENSGLITDGTGGSTTLAATFAAAATTLTLASVDGIVNGAAISGTGIAPGTTVTAVNTGTRVVTISPAASGAGTAGAIITVAGVVNRTALTKNSGLGVWTLSGNNTFTGNVAVNTGDLVITNSSALGVGPKTVTVVPSANPASLSSLVLDGSGGNISLPGNLSFTTSYDALNSPFITPLPGEAAIINSAGNNTIAGNITATSGGGSTSFLSNAGNLTLSGTLAANTSNRNFHFRGASTGRVSGPINNGSNPVGILKDAGTGTWTLAGTNGFTGNTTVTEGTLRLDYATNDTTKLSNTGVLILNGGTLDLAGGTHTEVVASTTLSPGKTSYITRSSGGAKIQLQAVTAAGASLVLAEDGIAETDILNSNGVLPWARVLVGGQPVLATNATNLADGPITAYAGAYLDVTRLGPSSIPDSFTDIVRIVNGGTAGNITLAASPRTQVGFLQMGATAGPATIAPANDTDVFVIGTNTAGSIWQTPTAGALTIGSTPNQGVLVAGDLEDNTPATLTLSNDSVTNLLTVNSVIGNNGTDVVSLATGGNITLNGDNTFTGSLSAGAGLLTVTGDNTFDGALTVNNGATVVLSGDNAGRPAGTSGLTVVNAGGVLQLQANAGNTVSDVSSALSVERTLLQPLTLNAGSILQLRSDSSVTFAGGTDLGGLGSSTATFDVNNLGSGSGNTLTIAPGGFNVNTTTINVTGGNGYSLATGTINNVTAAGILTLNPTTGNHVLGGYTAGATLSTTLALGGTATGNQVLGAISNPLTSGATTVTKSGTSTWLLSGNSNYTGNTTISDGTLKIGHANALGATALPTVSGTGVLDLNGFNLSFNTIGGGANTAAITDGSATAGVTTLSFPALGTTIATRILDGPNRAVRVNVKNNNSATTFFSLDTPSTFSGGLVLGHNGVTGTRLRISAPPVTVGSAGAIVSSPYGTGPITIGETAADKAGVLLDTGSGFTIANAIVFNTTLGNDQPGFRLDTGAHVLSGTITANLSNALFSSPTGGGAARLTGQVTGPNGLELNNSAITITLANQTANANNYAGPTTIGTGAFLILGAADQIPNGALKGNVANGGTLNISGFSETINGLSGAGVVTSTGSGTLTVGDNDATATFAGTTSGSLGLAKTGGGTQTLTGAIGHSGDTTVTQGTLEVSPASTFADGADVKLATGGTLHLATAGTDTIDSLFLNGTPQAVGKWGRTGAIAAGLGADFETGLITGDGLLNVTNSGVTTPFGTWINTFFPGETNPAIIGQTADPDHDGVDNITEFAFAGHPNSGSENGKIYVFAADSDFDGDTDKELILTAAIRTGAGAFGNGAPSTAASVADGITYSIQGSTTLSSFGTTVNVVPTAITTDLPPAGAGYSYRSFSLSGSNGLTLTPGKGFLRATVTAP